MLCCDKTIPEIAYVLIQGHDMSNDNMSDNHRNTPLNEEYLQTVYFLQTLQNHNCVASIAYACC